MFATITAQGQLTIPAKFRKHLGLTIPVKVRIREEKTKLIIEKVSDIFSAKGMFADKALTGMPIDKVIALEESNAYTALQKKYTSHA